MCGVAKPREDFNKQSRAKDGLYTYCRPCSSARTKAYKAKMREKGVLRYQRMRQKYGVDAMQYQALTEQQQNKCAICETGLIHAGQTASSACVDHCHTTGKVRGLLCYHCNRALGLFKDSQKSLQSAIDYLRKTS
ncbi:endonuclease VII domain-containing protein [Caballeronia temeraria]